MSWVSPGKQDVPIVQVDQFSHEQHRTIKRARESIKDREVKNVND
jgi:hypothetical protein